MSLIQPVQPAKGVSIEQLPAPKKATDKPVFPVQPKAPILGMGQTGGKTLPVQPQPGVMSTAKPSSEGGLMAKAATTATTATPQQAQAAQQVSQPAPQPAVSANSANDKYGVTPPVVKDNVFTPKAFVSDGKGGVTSDKQYQYDPNDKSLVQNQITGLLDPNSEIMRKAQAQANSYSASRGLQSSSIGNEVALSSMIDKALPIAQQDAQTFNQAQQLGWQNQFSSDQTNLKNQQDAAMADKQGAINNQLQNNQMDWQTSEKNADRQFQTQLEDLKYKQQLGTLDKQQSLQLAQMERSAQIQTDRDAILQKYQVELNELQNDQRWKELNAQIQANFETQTRGFDQQTKMEYGNAQSTAVNAAMQAIGMAMSNPNMTAAQQQAAIANIVSTLQSQANMLSVIYGASATTPPPLVTPPPATGNTGSTGGSGSTGGGSGGTGGSTGTVVNQQAKTGTYPGAGYIGGDVGLLQQQR